MAIFTQEAVPIVTTSPTSATTTTAPGCVSPTEGGDGASPPILPSASSCDGDSEYAHRKPPHPDSSMGLQVSDDDMIKAFMDAMFKHDFLVGTISNYHLALVPQRENGVKHPDCLELARRFFFAIDANKTGSPRLSASDSVAQFMGKTPSFESKCVLGQLYTRIKQEAKTLSNVHFTGGEEDNVFFDLDILRKGEDMHSFKQEAQKDFVEYKDESMAWFRQNKQFQADPEHYRKLKGDFSCGLRRKKVAAHFFPRRQRSLARQYEYFSLSHFVSFLFFFPRLTPLPSSNPLEFSRCTPPSL
jgi:hypothetical protein